MGSLITKAVTSPGSTLKDLACGASSTFGLIYPFLRGFLFLVLESISLLYTIISWGVGFAVWTYFAFRTGTGLVSDGLKRVNERAAGEVDNWLRPGATREGVSFPWVLLGTALAILRALVRWTKLLVGAAAEMIKWGGVWVIFVFIGLFVEAIWTNFETNPEDAFNIGNVFWEAISSMYNLVAGTWNFYVDWLSPTKPFLDLAVGTLWQAFIIAAEAVLATVFGNSDLGTQLAGAFPTNNLRSGNTSPFERGLLPLAPYHEAVALDLPISRHVVVGERSLIGVLTMSDNNKSIISGLAGLKVMWIPVFSVLFVILDLMASIGLIIFEFFFEILFPILNAIVQELFEYLEGFTCCLSSPVCCLREGVRSILVFLVGLLNGFLGGIASIFNGGEIVEVIDPSGLDAILCTDNEIPGGYLCECSDFYQEISACPTPVVECVEEGTTNAGETIYRQYERRFPGDPGVSTSSGVTKSTGCPKVADVVGGRTLRAERRRKLQSPTVRKCTELRRLPVCIRHHNQNWLVQVADCSAERLLYLGDCDTATPKENGVPTLQRFMRTRRGLNVKITQYRAPETPAQPAKAEPLHHDFTPDENLCGMAEAGERTGSTISRVGCYVQARYAELKEHTLKNSWVAQRAREAMQDSFDRSMHVGDHEHRKHFRDLPKQEGLFFPEMKRGSEEGDEPGMLMHHASRVLREMQHRARVWRTEGVGSSPHEAIESLHTALVNAHTDFMRKQGLTTRVAMHKGIMTHLGERLGHHAWKKFQELPVVQGKLTDLKGSLLRKERRRRRKLQSTGAGAGVDTSPNGQDPNVDIGVFSAQTNTVCDYTCPDGSCVPLEESGTCQYPEKWYFSTYIRWAAYVVRQASVNSDYRILTDNTWKCWLSYDTRPETYPVRASVYIRLFWAESRGDDAEVKRIQDGLTYCWPLTRELPRWNEVTNTFKQWAEEKCGVEVGSNGQLLRNCVCPQYWQASNVGNYAAYWIAGSPLYF